jgi:hypothetical protein
MYHKSSSLSHLKVQKIEPILQLLKSSFINHPQGIPPIVDCCILNIYLFQKNDICVFITQCPMFFSHLWLDMLFCVSIQGLTLMKKTSLLFVNHWFTWISTTINNSNYVPIDLNVIGHESFEVWIVNSIFYRHLV